VKSNTAQHSHFLAIKIFGEESVFFIKKKQNLKSVNFLVTIFFPFCKFIFLSKKNIFAYKSSLFLHNISHKNYAYNMKGVLKILYLSNFEYHQIWLT